MKLFKGCWSIFHWLDYSDSDSHLDLVHMSPQRPLSKSKFFASINLCEK